MVELQDFDMAEHLRSEEEIQLYLNEVLKEDDVDLILSALGDIAKARNMSQLAREVGVSREGLYKALSGNGNPTFSTVLKVMKALNLTLEVKKRFMLNKPSSEGFILQKIERIQPLVGCRRNRFRRDKRKPPQWAVIE